MMRAMPRDQIDEVMARLRIGPDDPNASDVRALVEYVTELGANTDEIITAAVLESLGPLALDFAIRPPGECLPLDEFATASEVDTDLLQFLLALEIAGLGETPAIEDGDVVAKHFDV